MATVRRVTSSSRPEKRGFDAVLPAPFGALGVRLQDGRLAGLEFLPPGTKTFSGGPEVESVAAELEAYYANHRHRFGLPLALAGTPFRLRVWQALLTIPPGESLTYGQVAARLGSSPRAVGQAVGDNPVPVIVPCHRVLAAQGLGGFMHGRDGFPLEVKKWLLRHEGLL
ncbi:MAG TPA: methylated-DNA--[protein]-cysteine S-methyltransferase [Parasulfuritortus sp.]